MMATILQLAFGILTLAIVCGLVRLARGPTVIDRIMAFDFLSVNLVVLFALMAVKGHLLVMLDAALVLSLLGFLSTVALTRYLLTGRVMK